MDEWIGGAAWRQLKLTRDSAEIPRREVETDELRAVTYAGLPYGELDIIDRLEQQAQRPLRRGRIEGRAYRIESFLDGFFTVESDARAKPLHIPFLYGKIVIE